MGNVENTGDKITEELLEDVQETPIDEVTETQETVEEAVETEETVEEVAETEETVEEVVETEEEVTEATDTEDAVVEEPESETEEAETDEVKEAEGEETEAKSDAETIEADAEPEKEKKPLSKKAKIWIASVAAFLGVLIVVYFAMSFHYKERLFMRTSVNHMDCSNMTMKEVEKVLQKQVEKYTLTIVKSDGKSETIKGKDFDIEYVGYKKVEEAFEKQNQFLWPRAMFTSNNIQAEVLLTYNHEKLDVLLGELDFVKAENQVAPVAATVVFNEKEFVIQEEVYGTQIDWAKLLETTHESVQTLNDSFDLQKTKCYVQPKFTTKSDEVHAAMDAMNHYLDSEITYQYDGIEVVLNKDIFATWIYVDENMTPTVSLEYTRAYAQSLSQQFNTNNRAGIMVTPAGKEVTIENAILGRIVGVDAEGEQLVKEIQAGEKVSRSPIFSREATPEGQYVWGTTYVEVDLGTQHMWFIQNGAVTFESDVVTGKPSTPTTAGIFTILEKMRNKTLRGNIMPNGQREYETPVAYWARVTWGGIGFHDATWQPGFGGNRYRQGYGSHGCINMPLSAVRTFYDMVHVGCPVVIHY